MGWNHQLETCGFLEENVLQRIQQAVEGGRFEL